MQNAKVKIQNTASSIENNPKPDSHSVQTDARQRLTMTAAAAISNGMNRAQYSPLQKNNGILF